MIQAVIFDLDGTLVQTERLKAISYARAAAELRPGAIGEADVLEFFKTVVGLARREVALALIQRFGLEDAARARMAEFGVQTPWQAFVQIRLRIYDEMLADPEVLRANQWPHNVALLRESRRAGCKIGLATMSYCPQVQRVLGILELTDAFDFVAARDDVEHGKPDPEIYRLVARELAVPPGECLVIEDSPTGVKAALGAGMNVIAVTTPFTRQQFRETDLLDRRWVVDDPDTLVAVVRHLMESLR
ncbi:MAG: HAD family phosphatase [Chloroflexi bacterium]|nr:HAD family phosphatase [Chloroflexota bacterium]